MDDQRFMQNYLSKAAEAFERNNFDYALTLLGSVLQAHPEDAKARQLLRLSQIRKSEAAPLTPLRWAILTLSCTVPFIRMFVYSARKQWTRCINACEGILRSNPKNTAALKKLAFCAMQLGWTQTALDTYELVKKVSPSDIFVLRQLSQLYLSGGDLERSKKILHELVRVAPNDPAAERGFKDLAAMKTIEKGGWGETQSYRDKIRDESQAEILERETRAVKSDEDFRILASRLREQIESNPRNPVLLKQLAELYAQQNELDEAIQTYEQLASVASFDANLQSQIGELKARKIQAQIAQVKNSLDRNPEDAVLQSEMRRLERQRREMLLDECKNRVDRYPNNLTYRYELGALYYDLGNYNAAIQELQLAVKDAQKRTRAMHYLGRCFKELGFLDLAEKQFLKILEEATDLDAFTKEVIYNLGVVYEAMGQDVKAVSEYKKIFEVDISYKDVAEKIQKAYKK